MWLGDMTAFWEYSHSSCSFETQLLTSNKCWIALDAKLRIRFEAPNDHTAWEGPIGSMRMLLLDLKTTIHLVHIGHVCQLEKDQCGKNRLEAISLEKHISPWKMYSVIHEHAVIANCSYKTWATFKAQKCKRQKHWNLQPLSTCSMMLGSSWLPFHAPD